MTHRPAARRQAGAGWGCGVRPSGYKTVLCRKTDGFARAAGVAAAMAAPAVTADAAAKRHAARRPSRAAIITAITGSAGHAVIFMAHAIPVASAAPAGREG